MNSRFIRRHQPRLLVEINTGWTPKPFSRYNKTVLIHGGGLDFLKNFPDVIFVPGRFFMWSPLARSMTYDTRRIHTNNGKIALLHELGHARLGHRTYKYDMELLRMEMDAWDVARELAPQFGLTVDENHIAQAISTYDHWLSKRATCPDCENFSLQKDRNSYACFACGSKWDVNWRKDRRVTRRVTHRFKHVGYIHDLKT